MMKVTALHGHPRSPDEFERYYAGTQLPIAAEMKGVARIELTKFAAGTDGGKPAFHRMAERYFTTRAQMEQTPASPQGEASVADPANFATGGVTIVFGSVEA